MKYWILVAWLLWSCENVVGQFLVPDTAIPVFQATGFLDQPWAGGLNQSQISTVDFEGDGVNELVLYDRGAIQPKIFSFDQQSQQWIWSGGKGKHFPPMSSWLLTAELTCDEYPELIAGHPDSPSVLIYVGTGPYTWGPPVSLSDQQGNPVYVLEIDLPGLGDVDGDGDLDILTMNPAGTQALFYENIGACDSLSFSLANNCWGEFSEGGLSSQIFLNTSCLVGGGEPRTETGGGHAGSTLTLADIDGDQLVDLLVGDINQSTITYLHNGGVQGFASMDAVTPDFPSGSAKINLKLFPAVFVIDADQDGMKDLIAVPNDPVAGRNMNQLWLYRNTGGNGFTSLIRQQEDWLVEEMIDVGERSTPSLVDVNGDGQKDLIIGNHSLRGNNDESTSTLWYYRNTGTSSAPAFDLISSDWLSVGTIFNPRIAGLAPSFADLDGDGDQDMILGDRSGEIHYFRNNAGPGAPMQLSLVAPSFLSLDAGQEAVPELQDISGDGLPDLVIGNKSGELIYLENQSLPGATLPDFSAPVFAFGGINGQYGTSLVPRFREEGGVWKLYIGTEEGKLKVFDQISTNSGAIFQLEEEAFGNLPLIRFMSPTFFSSNGTLRYLIGSWQGGLHMFQESVVNSLDSRGLSFDFWIRSEGETLKVEFSDPVHDQGSLTIVDLQGRLIATHDILPGSRSVSFDLRFMGNGLICLIVQINGEMSSKKVMLNN